MHRWRRFRERRLLVRNYRRAACTPPALAPPPLWQLPAGFAVTDIGATGIRMAERFCTPSEAAELIELGRRQVSPSTVIGPEGHSVQHAYRTSSDTLIKLADANPLVRQIVTRAAALLGLPPAHSEALSLTRYLDDQQYKAHLDHDGSLRADRLYTVLLYLNDLLPEQGGATRFEKLNVDVQPVCGRALFWVNADQQRLPLQSTLHAALPVRGCATEKWVVQLWFRTYPTSSGMQPDVRSEVSPAQPLSTADPVPPGVGPSSAAP